MLKSMNPMDIMMLAMESPETPMHVAGVQILRKPRGAGRDYLRKLRDELMSIPASGAPFNYQYTASGPLPGIPGWRVLDKVDLREHVFHHALPWPGTEKELFELVSRLNSGLLDRSRPLWEHHLIEGLTGNRYATFSRIHHAYIDGQWGMRLYRETTSADPDTRGLPPFWGVKMEQRTEAEPRKQGKQGEEPRRGLLELGRAGVSESVEVVSELGTAFGRVIESFRHPTDGGLVPIYQAPDSILNGRVTAKRELGVTELAMPRLKRLARSQGATINDVVMAICGGALRHYLLERDSLPKEALVANMIVAVTRASDKAGGTAFASGQVSLATHLKDPVRRFQAVRSSSQHAKELIHGMPSPVALNIYMGLIGLPFMLFTILGKAEKAHAHNVVISNVVGLRDKRYSNGALIEADYPMSLLVPGQAMNITVISRRNMLDVAVLVCPDLAPDAHRVGEAIAESLDELERALARKRRPVAAARRSTARKVPRRKSVRRR